MGNPQFSFPSVEHQVYSCITCIKKRNNDIYTNLIDHQINRQNNVSESRLVPHQIINSYLIVVRQNILITNSNGQL